jgi:pheromone shutdown protein TraB
VVARTIARVRPDIVLVALSATRLLTIEPNTVAAELLMKKANFASTGFLNEFTKKPIMEVCA